MMAVMGCSTGLKYAKGRFTYMIAQLEKKVKAAIEQVRSGVADPGDVIEVLTEVQEMIEQTKQANKAKWKLLTRLTFSEEIAFKNLIDALPDSTGGHVVLTEIADGCGISRSIFTNLIHRMQSAGLLHAHSLGSKGIMIQLADGLTKEDLRRYVFDVA